MYTLLSPDLTNEPYKYSDARNDSPGNVCDEFGLTAMV